MGSINQGAVLVGSSTQWGAGKPTLSRCPQIVHPGQAADPQEQDSMQTGHIHIIISLTWQDALMQWELYR